MRFETPDVADPSVQITDRGMLRELGRVSQRAMTLNIVGACDDGAPILAELAREERAVGHVT